MTDYATVRIYQCRPRTDVWHVMRDVCAKLAELRGKDLYRIEVVSTDAGYQAFIEIATHDVGDEPTGYWIT